MRKRKLGTKTQDVKEKEKKKKKNSINILTCGARKCYTRCPAADMRYRTDAAYIDK